MRKIIPFICIGVIVIIFSIAIIFFTKEIDTKVLTYFKNYNVSSLIGDDDYINVSIYINNKKSYFIDKDQITTSYLLSKSENDSIKLELKDVVKSNESIKINNEEYYLYLFKFKLLINIEDNYNFELEEAYLNLCYQNNKNYKLNIGQFTFNKYKKHDSSISISLVKPLTFEDTNSYLGGVVYGIQNNLNKSITIKQIDILNVNVSCGDNIKEVSNYDSIDFEDVSGYNHSYVNMNNKDINITINANENKKIIVPLYYVELFILNKFPLKITYLYNGNTYEYIYGIYNYYNPIKEVVSDDNYMIYKISK